jgi:hypothetical protein
VGDDLVPIEVLHLFLALEITRHTGGLPLDERDRKRNSGRDQHQTPARVGVRPVEATTWRK